MASHYPLIASFYSKLEVKSNQEIFLGCFSLGRLYYAVGDVPSALDTTASI